VKAFVTGSTGLVGSALCERLVRDGHRVRALVRPTSDVSFLDRLGSVDLITGDMTDNTAKLAQAVGDADTVFHTAALVDDWADRAAMVRVNVTGTESLLEACTQRRTRRVVYLSSLVVFGMKPQNNLDESAPVVHTRDNYNYTKILAEQVVQRYQAGGTPIVIIRPPYIYGPRDRQFFPRLVDAIMSGKFKYIGRGDNPLTLCYVGNLVDAMMLAAENQAAVGNTYIITDGDSITRRELVDIICRSLGVDPPKRHAPVFVARAAVPVLEGVYRLFRLKGRPLVNRFKFKFMHTPLTFDIGKARDELGYEPGMRTSEGLGLSIDWYRDNVLSVREDTAR